MTLPIELQDFSLAAFVHKDIGGRDIAMDSALSVGGFQCVGNLNRESEGGFGFEWFCSDELLQDHSIQKFSRKKFLAGLFANLINPCRYSDSSQDARCSLGFAAKAGASDWGSWPTDSGRNLRGHETVKAGVHGLVDDSCASVTESSRRCDSARRLYLIHVLRELR